jgi:exoribonuclease R
MIDIPVFFGIIHFSSQYTYTDEKDFIRKETSSFLKTKAKILARTKKINQKNDMYAILKVEQELCISSIIVCSVLEYISEIDKTTITSNIFKLMSVCHWTNTKKMNNSFEKLSHDLTPNREILSDASVYSIDPKGCLDIDDALHYKPLYNSQNIITGYEIGIHIADVTSFIEENSVYDLELRKRVETLYMNDDIVHMIPETLSIEHISLLANKQRRTFSIILLFDKEYNIITISFKKMLITVTKNLSYEDAENNLQLEQLFNIGKILKNSIKDSFKDNEIYDTHQMVAVYMILANKIVAEKIVSYDSKNVILRTHKTNLSNAQIKSKNYENELFDCAKAQYQTSSSDSNHAGLHLKYYTHFTSPIRRYADILVHRQLFNVLCNQKINSCNDIENTIKYINLYEQYYSLLKRNYEIMRIVDTLHIEIVDAQIVNINTEKYSMRLFIPKYNIQYEYYITNESLLIEICDDKIIIYDNEKEKTYALFQMIKCKLVPAKRHMLKLLVEIIDPMHIK